MWLSFVNEFQMFLLILTRNDKTSEKKAPITGKTPMNSLIYAFLFPFSISRSFPFGLKYRLITITEHKHVDCKLMAIVRVNNKK